IIFPGMRSSRLAARSALIGKPSCEVRKAEGQTVSPVLELISSVPKIPGMTTTGRFPVLDFAAAKICSRLGVRRAEIHPLETSDRAIKVSSKRRELAIRGLVNGHRPTAIDQARHEPCAKSVVDI